MTVILIIGKWDFRWRFLNEQPNVEVDEEYRVAEAAMRVQYPKALIINPCRYFYSLPVADPDDLKGQASIFQLYKKKVDKIHRLVMMGAFTRLVLLDDWFYFPEANMALTMLAEGYKQKFYEHKPTVSLLSDDQKEIGRERLAKMAEAEHSSKRQLNTD